RLDAEDTELKDEIKSRVEKRSGVDERVSDAETTLAAAERLVAELTTALAGLTAKRNQLEANVRSHRDRLARLDQEIAHVAGEEQKLAQETSGLGDLAALADAMAGAQEGLAQSEAAAQGSEAAHAAARQSLEAARSPLNEADKRVQRLETEARTISKLVNGETKNLWPPIIDGITVAKGFEKALGAALGDDLDAPVDPSAPMRWTHAGVIDGDPALPEGVESLATHVQAPSELARRLAQIGVVAKERGAELLAQLKTGKRLVSPEGDVWRWDGFVAAAHAPTGAARRLAERARLVDIENELEQARIDAAAKRQALETAEAELKAASSAESAAREAWRAAQREADSARERHAATEREINRHAARRSALTEAHSRVAADALAAAESVMAETDREAKVSLEALSSAREACARAEERMEGTKRRLADIEREIHDMLEVEPHAAAALAEIEPGAELPPLAEIEENLEKLRRDRERLGAVHLRAEEELREGEAQHTSLTTERDDLVEAIKRLRQGIQSLNREARERLMTSFETVNGHFKRLFVELFGGGEAALHLIESDDPLEAGLEIIAKPPGKKPQTLSLLSGGEQALTALALIFAVFLTNPSPICVLDEVDAPLDDHNVERFCTLLHEMTGSTETRFVIITHNPITMARMNRLFGVTMAERGVSQLVSVDLEDAVKILDQNVA